MLVAMTFNVWLFLAVILGSGLGKLIDMTLFEDVIGDSSQSHCNMPWSVIFWAFFLVLLSRVGLFLLLELAGFLSWVGAARTSVFYQLTCIINIWLIRNHLSFLIRSSSDVFRLANRRLWFIFYVTVTTCSLICHEKHYCWRGQTRDLPLTESLIYFVDLIMEVIQ